MESFNKILERSKKKMYRNLLTDIKWSTQEKSKHTCTCMHAWMYETLMPAFVHMNMWSSYMHMYATNTLILEALWNIELS